MPATKRDKRPDALELHARGGTTREIAAALGVSHQTIARWVREADVAPTIAERAARIAAAAPDAAPGTTLPERAPEKLRVQIDHAWAMVETAKRAGDYKSSAQFSKLAAELTNSLLRAERGEIEDADALHISRHEIDQAMARVNARVKAIVDRPLLCAHCSRQLSVDYGTKVA
jgi:transcriptional regulator with XRE-family HTH domain